MTKHIDIPARGKTVTIQGTAYTFDSDIDVTVYAYTETGYTDATGTANAHDNNGNYVSIEYEATIPDDIDISRPVGILDIDPPIE